MTDERELRGALDRADAERRRAEEALEEALSREKDRERQARDRSDKLAAGAAVGASISLVVFILAMSVTADSPDCTGPLGLFCVFFLPVLLVAETMRWLLGCVAAILTVVLTGVFLSAASGKREGGVSSGR